MTISAVLKPLTGKLVRGFESHPRRFQPAWNGINEPAFARWEESATLPSASKCPRVPVHTANRQSHARSRARPASDRVRRLPDQSRALIVDALGLPLEGSWPRRSCDLAVISPCPRFDRVPGFATFPRSFSPYPRTPTPPGMPRAEPSRQSVRCSGHSVPPRNIRRHSGFYPSRERFDALRQPRRNLACP